MSIYSRVGRPRPQGGGLELAVWYLMRLSGVALFVLALGHFLIMHLLFDPSNQTAEWITSHRWNSIFWRTFDWLLLQTVLFHSFFGVRTVVQDYIHGGARTAVLMGLYLLAALLFVAGTVVVMTMPISALGK
jgi:succinate dehydrogenase / fumarate reductase membrane anchor subunit